MGNSLITDEQDGWVTAQMAALQQLGVLRAHQCRSGHVIRNASAPASIVLEADLHDRTQKQGERRLDVKPDHQKTGIDGFQVHRTPCRRPTACWNVQRTGNPLVGRTAYGVTWTADTSGSREVTIRRGRTFTGVASTKGM